MKLIRSWPAKIPENRCYVVDTLPRFVMADYSYSGLVDFDDDIMLIEWDVAVEKEQLDAFVDIARSNPDDVVVAPYRIYQATARDTVLKDPIWVMRRYRDASEQSMRWVTEDDATCHLFGLGLTYLPRDLIRAFVDAYPAAHFNDSAFSGWHYRNVRAETPIAWDVRPVHLHYPIERTI